MIDFLAALVAPQFGAAGLTRMMEVFVPAAQAIVLSLVAARFAFTGLQMAVPSGAFSSGLGEFGAVLVRAAILLFVLGNWGYFAGLLQAQGPELAARAIGSSATPDAIARKMVSLVSRYSDATVYGVQFWNNHGALEGTQSADGALPKVTDIGIMMVAIVAVLLAQVIAAAIVVMIAMPKILLMVCLAMGPFAVAAMMSNTHFAEEFAEGWGESTATALLALPVMAILSSFLSAITLPDPNSGLLVGNTALYSADIVKMLADDVAVYLVIGQLMFMVLPVSSGLIQGRMPSVSSFMGLIISIITFAVKPARLLMVKSFGFVLGKARGA